MTHGGERSDETEVFRGISGSPGIAIGTVYVIGNEMAQIPRRTVHVEVRDVELERFRGAAARAKAALVELAESSKDRSAAYAVLSAYALMIDDPMLFEAVELRIRQEGRCAEWAVALAIHELAQQLWAVSDPYLRERGRDIEFVGEHVIRAFDEAGEKKRLPPGPVVLVACDLSPADTAGYVAFHPPESEDKSAQPSAIVAFVTEGGSRTSHTSITARALKLPAVVGVSDVCDAVTTGDTIIVDGLRGVVIARPTESELSDALARAERHRAYTQELGLGRERIAETRDHTVLAVRANVEAPEEAKEAHDEGAEGVGLYRTEYLFIDRSSPPSEEEQFSAFRSVLHAMPDRPVVLRTFDIGGDKFASTFKVPVELNPMLGLRAIRLAQSRPEVFMQHLRAMVRASAHGDVRIMVPMVASLSELDWARTMLDRAVASVRAEGEPVGSDIPLGVMIEVPAAALMAEHFARRASFMSIGTNDLIQYTLAVDRASRRLAHLASPFDPAIARLINLVVEAGRRHDCPVSVCGAMAGEPLAAVLLLGLGVREFSMEIAAIPEIRETFRRVTVEEAAAAAQVALEAPTAAAVEKHLLDAFGAVLGDLLSGEDHA
jgi:phosphoenolpyruvate-protein phosphotransferase (PTS system enzyme I)